MARYASGKKSKAISDRSGFKVKYTDLMTTWDGLRVEREEYEPKHPQLTPAKNVFDATALFKPRPDNDPDNIKFYVGYNYNIFLDPRERPSVGLEARGQVGKVETRFIIGANVTGQVGTFALGTFSVAINQNVNATGLVTNSFIGAVTAGTVVYAVTVSNPGSGNKYYIDGVQQATLDLQEGQTYRFDQSDSSNSGHPLRFSTTSNGTHGGGSVYTTGVYLFGTPGSSGAYTEITVASGAPTLYYYCTNHSGMGGQLNTTTARTYTIQTSTSNSGVAGTTGLGGQAIVGSPPTSAGVAATGAVGSVSITLNGWGLGGWGSGTWGN